MTDTWNDVGLLALRLGVGGALAAHGAQKLFGWFGGYGLDVTGQWMDSLGFPGSGKRNALLAGLAGQHRARRGLEHGQGLAGVPARQAQQLLLRVVREDDRAAEAALVRHGAPHEPAASRTISS